MARKMNLMAAVFAGLMLAGARVQADVIAWGYENWLDADAGGQVDEWGTYNLNFSPGTSAGESIATGTIGSDNVFGKAYYVTGVGSSDVVSLYKYLYLETYDVQGNMKIALSGASDADFFDATPHVVSGDTGNPNVIFNPGPYVFDVSSWATSQNWSNVAVQLIAEGGTGNGFSVRRVFLADYNPLASQTPPPPAPNPVPEPATLLTLGLGLAGAVARKKLLAS